MCDILHKSTSKTDLTYREVCYYSIDLKCQRLQPWCNQASSETSKLMNFNEAKITNENYHIPFREDVRSLFFLDFLRVLLSEIPQAVS